MPTHRPRRPHLHLLILLFVFAAPALAQVSPASILLPSGIAYDAAGNLYFADANRHQVFESTLGGALLVIAGNGTQGYAGDGGSATSAKLNGPQALAVGADGMLYIADTGNHRIRAVSNGTITTFAGSGVAGYSGDNGPAASAALSAPNALALDLTGALLVCDSGNHRLRRIASGVITTIAGSGTQGFSGDGAAAALAQLDTPSGVAVSSDGRIFLSDTHNHRVRVIAASGIVTTFAGTGQPGLSGDNGPAVSAQLDYPRGLAVTASGGLLVADDNNQRIRSVSSAGTITTLVGGAVQGDASDGTAALAAALNEPRAVAITSFGYPALADAANHTVRVLASDGNLYIPAGLASGRASTISIAVPPGAAYGQSSATVGVAGAAGTPQGVVQLMAGSTPAGSATLSSGSATFALNTLAAGSYALSATYAGDGLNPAASSATVALTIARTNSAVIAQPPAQNSYAGLPLLLNANVTSTTPLISKATPTGTVNFMEGTTTVATAQLAAGIASGAYLSPPSGTHSIVAAYMGDANFSPSTSPAVTVVIQPLPDFTITPSGSTTQSVAAGQIASYTFTVAPLSAPFTGAVSFAVSGLPFGATASFTPAQVVPGASSATVTLSVQTLAAPVVRAVPTSRAWYGLLAVPLFLTRRRRRRQALAALSLCLVAIAGCGTRVNQPPSAVAGAYGLRVSATSTNLVGAPVVHDASVTLNVQ